MEQQPSIGRIVHFGFYVRDGEAGIKLVARAAIITEVHQPSGQVRLTIFHPEGPSTPDELYEHSPTLEVHRWTWPPRTP